MFSHFRTLIFPQSVPQDVFCSRLHQDTCDLFGDSFDTYTLYSTHHVSSSCDVVDSFFLTMCTIKNNVLMLMYVLNPASVYPCCCMEKRLIYVRITIITDVWAAWLWNLSQLNVWTHAFFDCLVHWDALLNIILKY